MPYEKKLLHLIKEQFDEVYDHILHDIDIELQAGIWALKEFAQMYEKTLEHAFACTPNPNDIFGDEVVAMQDMNCIVKGFDK